MLGYAHDVARPSNSQRIIDVDDDDDEDISLTCLLTVFISHGEIEMSEN